MVSALLLVSTSLYSHPSKTSHSKTIDHCLIVSLKSHLYLAPVTRSKNLTFSLTETNGKGTERNFINQLYLAVPGSLLPTTVKRKVLSYVAINYAVYYLAWTQCLSQLIGFGSMCLFFLHLPYLRLCILVARWLPLPVIPYFKIILRWTVVELFGYVKESGDNSLLLRFFRAITLIFFLQHFGFPDCLIDASHVKPKYWPWPNLILL